MMSVRTRKAVSAGVLFALASFVYADRPAGDDTAMPAEDFAVLEALYSAQQARLEKLQRQVADAASQDADTARVEAMKEQIRAVLSESEFRESLMPAVTQAGYDNGFFIRSSDEKFSMKIQWYLHFRWTHYGVNTRNRYLAPRAQRDDRTGFDFNRARLRIGGHAYDPSLTYFFSFTHAADTSYDARSIYAWVNYKFRDEFQMTFGQMRLASTRAQVSDIMRYQFTELPFTDAVFGSGVGLGVRFWGRLFDKRLSYYLDVVNSMNATGRTITNDPAEIDNNPAILFRAVWHALGDNPGNEFPNQSDLDFHETPALDLGFHYSFNEDEYDLATARIPFAIPRRLAGQGGFGLTTSNGMQVHTFGWEGAFQYRGFSATSEFHIRLLDPRRAGRRPFTPYWLLTREGGDSSFYGGYVQVGYMLPIPGFENKIELAARLEGLGGVDPGDEGVWIYTAGVNYFIKGSRIKLQADISKVSEAPISAGTYGLANLNDEALIARVQLAFAF
jgi:phosphate-selective porin OprO/OprP